MSVIHREKFVVPVVLAFCVILLGCASAGSKSITNEEKVSKIIEGETTKAQVKEILGEPNMARNIGGSDVWFYSYSKVQKSVVGAVPVVGIFAGKDKHESRSLRITFTDHGIVKEVKRGMRRMEY